MKKEVFLILFLLIPFTYADWYLNSEEVNVDLIITGGFSLTPEGSAARITQVSVNQSFIPQTNYRQNVRSLRATPKASTSDVIYYEWTNPNYGDYVYSLDSSLTLHNTRKKITNRVAFPIVSLPTEVDPYIIPSATIDSDHPDISELANSLAAGEDDLYIVVSKLASWTRNNIDYNLSTLTVSASKPASWVFEHRKGVCDELTNLFIAMCRSLGIPAKFVSGVSYTESDLFPEQWGAHGWAEVYFPGVGWVDYDVTYGELGYINPTHIKLKEGIDATSSSVRYSWLGRNIDLQSQQLDIDTTVTSYTGRVSDGIDITLEPLKSTMGFDSYNSITATITNTNDYYVSEEFQLFSTKEVEIIEPATLVATLKPQESTTLHWLIHIGELQSGFIYTIPVSAISSHNKTTQTTFSVSSKEPSYSRDDVEILAQSQAKKFEEKLSLDCSADKKEFNTDEQTQITCNLKNLGNNFYRKLTLCHKEDCKQTDLGISKEKTLTFSLSDSVAGKKETIITLDGSDPLADSVAYTVYDTAKISLVEKKHPTQVSYKEPFTLEFSLLKESFSTPTNVIVSLHNQGSKKVWELEALENQRLYKVQMRGSDLAPGSNRLDITVEYSDQTGKQYILEDSVPITLTNLSFGETLLAYSAMILRKIATLPGVIFLGICLLLLIGVVLLRR